MSGEPVTQRRLRRSSLTAATATLAARLFLEADCNDGELRSSADDDPASRSHAEMTSVADDGRVFVSASEVVRTDRKFSIVCSYDIGSPLVRAGLSDARVAGSEANARLSPIPRNRYRPSDRSDERCTSHCHPPPGGRRPGSS